MPKLKCPYTFPHKSRTAKVKYITGIGGYLSRDGKFPIEFNVGVYRANLDFPNLYSRILKEFRPDDPDDADSNRLFKEACRKVHDTHKDSLFDWALEDAQRTLHDTDTYNTLWEGTPLKVDLQLHGRGGKHLVIAEFDGLGLKGLDDEDLYKLLMEQDSPSGPVYYRSQLVKGNEWTVSAQQLDLLYRYVRQCEIDFTPIKAGAAVEDCAAWSIYSLAEHELENLKQQLADRQRLRSYAEMVRDALDMQDTEIKEAWCKLSAAAGLSPSDML